MQTVEHLMATIKHLDWQLTSHKHIVKKYKDLSVAQQLRINAQTVKMAALRSSRDALQKQTKDLKELVS